MTTTVVSYGQTLTSRLNMKGNDILVVSNGGALSVSSNAQTVRFNGTTDFAQVINSGTIENTASGGRAIRFETSVGANLNAIIGNFGLIRSDDDAIQIQAGSVTSGIVTINNTGTIQSTVGQGIDFAGGVGTFMSTIQNYGSIRSAQDDAIRVGSTGFISNTGSIIGGDGAGLAAKADGIQFEDSTTGAVNNYAGIIAGDRHGINAGEGSQINVYNNPGATIIGHNGSGVGSDGSATVLNFGRITGSFTPGVDVNSPLGGDTTDGIFDGDGDGIDIDFKATIENYGIVEGTGAGGHGSDGLPNTSEGIAAGGGSIINHYGALISGAGLGILIDDSSQGNAPYLTTILNEGTIIGKTGTAIRIISALDDTVTNIGKISGGNGTAILFGSGNNTLAMVGSQASIIGSSDGGAGIDSLDYSQYNGPVTINLATGTATATGGVTSFENVIGTAYQGDTITGNAQANKLSGLGGNDVLAGGAGNDVLIGGLGADRFVFTTADAGSANADTINDFNFGQGDRIDLVNVDGDVLTAGNQRFSFIGSAAFTGHAGELRYEKVGGETHVMIDNTGDGVADIVVNLLGSHNVTADYFVI